MNKESVLEQIDIIESNMRRLKVLCETDLMDKPNYDVPLYCCMKARVQLENLEKEIVEAKNKLETSKLE